MFSKKFLLVQEWLSFPHLLFLLRHLQTLNEYSVKVFTYIVKITVLKQFIT